MDAPEGVSLTSDERMALTAAEIAYATFRLTVEEVVASALAWTNTGERCPHCEIVKATLLVWLLGLRTGLKAGGRVAPPVTPAMIEAAFGDDWDYAVQLDPRFRFNGAAQ